MLFRSHTRSLLPLGLHCGPRGVDHYHRGYLCGRLHSGIAVHDELPSRQNQVEQQPGSWPGCLADRVGFEPTVACTTTVFETVLFGRSSTCPSVSLQVLFRVFLTTRRKELSQQRRRLVGTDATHQFGFVEKSRIAKNVVARAARSGLFVVRPKYHSCHASV